MTAREMNTKYLTTKTNLLDEVSQQRKLGKDGVMFAVSVLGDQSISLFSIDVLWLAVLTCGYLGLLTYTR